MNNKGVIIGVIVALIVGLVAGYLFGKGRGGNAEMTTSGDTTAASSSAATSTGIQLMGSSTSTNPTVVAEGNSVSIPSQPAGMSVMVTSATLSQEAWIAIRDASGRTLGAALFPAGPQSNVSVPLLRATASGESYQALVYFDDGTKTFNLKTETIVLNADGSVAGTTFLAQ